MALDRKGIRLALQAALEDRLSVSGVKSVRTRDIIIDTIPDALLPLVVLQVAGGSSLADRLKPPLWTLHVDAAIYLRPSPTDADPDGSLDDLVVALEAALERQAGEDENSWWTTLGGRCSRACIAGEVEYYGGGPKGEVKAVVPIEIIQPTGKRGLP